MTGWREQLAKMFWPSDVPEQAPNASALEAGITALRAGDTETALRELERASAGAATQTERALIGRLKVQALLNDGRLDEAAALAESLRSLGNTGSAAGQWRIAEGLVALARHDLAGAKDQFEAAEFAANTASNHTLRALAGAYHAEVYLGEGNAFYAVKLLRDSIPRIAASGDVDHIAHFSGILGRALIETGHEPEGVGLIGRALETADHIGDRQQIRHWSMELARHALRDQRYFDAQTHLQRALRLMDGAIHTADRVAVLSNLARIELAGRHPNEALAYAEQALEASQALEHGPSRMTARLALGQALRASGRRAEALTMLREATAEGALPPEDERMLAGVLFENELLGEAVEVLSKQIASAAGTLDEALARRDLGLMLYRSGDLTGALAAWSPAVAIALDQRQTGLAVQLHCDIGTARRELGQPARALKEYEAALMLISRLGEHEAHIRGIVLSNAATAYAETGDAESADAFFTESIAIAARLGDTAAECTRTGNYGWFLTLVGRPRRAIATLERAIELSEAANLPLQRAVQTDNLGLAYDAMGDTAAALPKHRDALAQVAPLNAPGWQASIQINTAASLFSLNELDEAESLLTAALSTARQLNDPELLIRALTHQAALHLRLGDVAAADLSEAITLARRAEFRRLLAEALSVESQRRAMLGSALEAQSSWAEAARLYTILHMPQGKLHPAWLPA